MALQVAENIGDEYHIALQLNSIGNILIAIGKLDQALEYYQDAQARFQRLDLSYGVALRKKTSSAQRPNMEAPAQIRVYVLRDSPKIEIGDETIHMAGLPLELFVYLAVENKQEHSRDQLIDLLFGVDDPNRQKKFRTHALANIHATLKKLCLAEAGPPQLYFENSHVWVDAIAFAEQAQQALQPDRFPSNKTAIKNLVDLYEAQFLDSYIPSLESLREWRDRKRQDFATLYGQLLERLVRQFIQKQDYPTALNYAQHWFAINSENDLLPLQYLVWLHSNLHQHEMAVRYLQTLQIYERDFGILFGPTVEQWRHYLEVMDFVPEKLLRMPAAETLSYDQINWVASGLAGRRGEILQIAENLLVNKIYTSVCIAGMEGIGKTTVLRTVLELAKQMPRIEGVIDIVLTSDPTRETLIDEILRQMGHEHLLTLSYALRQAQLRQILQSRSYLIGLDEYAPDTVNWTHVLQFLTPILGQSRFLFATRQLKDQPEVLVVDLATLTVEEVTDWLRDDMANERVDELCAITNGLPLALKLIFGYMVVKRQGIGYAIPSLKKHLEQQVDWDYGLLFAWLWDRLDPIEQRIMFTLTIGDVQEGLPHSIFVRLFDATDNQDAHVTNVIAMNLVSTRAEDEVRYFIHGKLRSFLLSRMNTKFVSAAVFRFASYFFDFIREHQSDFKALDAHQRNLVNALKLGVQFRLPGTSAALIGAYTFLEQRGYYQVGAELIDQALDRLEMSAEDRIQLLNNGAKLFTKLGKHALSIDRLKAARILISQSQLTQFYSAIEQNCGIIEMELGDYDKAAEYYEVARQWAERYEQTVQMCNIMANFGTLAALQADYEKSRDYLAQCLSLAVRLNDLHLITFAQNALGYALSELGALDQAEEYYQDALHLLKKTKNIERLAYVFMNLGVLHHTKKLYQQAQDFLDEAFVLAEQIGHILLQVQIGWNIGDAQCARGEYLEAEATLKEYLITAQDCRLMRLATGILISLGKLYARQQKWDMARHSFIEALSGDVIQSEFNSQGLYGFALSVVAPTQIVGKYDETRTRRAIVAALDDSLRAQIRRFSVNETTLIVAERHFQQDLENFPHLNRFLLVDALLALLSEIQ